MLTYQRSRHLLLGSMTHLLRFRKFLSLSGRGRQEGAAPRERRALRHSHAVLKRPEV